MTKQEFIEQVARESGLSRADSAKAVDAFLSTIAEALKQGDTVDLAGFGKFASARRDAKSSALLAKQARLVDKASSLRKEADALERSQQAFDSRLASSRRALRKIAESV